MRTSFGACLVLAVLALPAAAQATRHEATVLGDPLRIVTTAGGPLKETFAGNRMDEGIHSLIADRTDELNGRSVVVWVNHRRVVGIEGKTLADAPILDELGLGAEVLESRSANSTLVLLGKRTTRMGGQQEWYRVRLNSRQHGWIHSSQVQIDGRSPVGDPVPVAEAVDGPIHALDLSLDPQLESVSLALGNQAWTEGYDGPVFLLGIDGQLGEGPQRDPPDRLGRTARYYLGSFSGIVQTTEAGIQRYNLTLTPLTLTQRDAVREGWTMRSRSYHVGRIEVLHDAAAELDHYVDFAPFGVEVEAVWQGQDWSFGADLGARLGLAYAKPTDPRRDTIAAPYGGLNLGLSAENRRWRFGANYHVKSTSRDKEHDEGRIGGFNAYVERSFGGVKLRFQIGKERWRMFAGHTNPLGPPTVNGCAPSESCHLGGRIAQLQVTVPLN